MKSDWETIGQLLHGTARAWRLKLDDRLKPMGLSQAKWRTLLHLSIASDALTQAEIAARLGVEEPSVVTLLHRLEREGWVTRQSSPRDRRCKIVHHGQLRPLVACLITVSTEMGIRLQEKRRSAAPGQNPNEANAPLKPINSLV